MHMKFCFAAIGAFALALSSASALNVRFLAWDDEVAARETAVVAGSQTRPIKDLHPLQRSPVVKVDLTETGDIFVRALDRTSDDGKPVDLPVRIGISMKSPLVILMPDPKAPSGLRGQAFEDSSGDFPWGSYRFLNVTGRPLVMGMGNKRYPLASGWKAVDVRDPGSKPFPVWFTLAEKPDTPLFTALWTPDEETRRLIILLPSDDPRLGPLAVKVIPEDRTTASAD
jgi:hypothetical protein